MLAVRDLANKIKYQRYIHRGIKLTRILHATVFDDKMEDAAYFHLLNPSFQLFPVLNFGFQR
jgi:hypothetical protein